MSLDLTDTEAAAPALLLAGALVVTLCLAACAAKVQNIPATPWHAADRFPGPPLTGAGP
jgi:hypothetical protein